MAVIDCFFYNGEKDILRLHLAIIAHYVDKIIICEAKTTFTGYKKPLYFFRDQRYFKPWWPQIDYYVVDENYSEEEIKLATSSPNTEYGKGAEHWIREFLQKESIKKALSQSNLQDDDTVLIGDVDEILDVPHLPIIEQNSPYKARLRVYAYYLNNRSSEAFWGNLVAKYADIKSGCLNEMRANTCLNTQEGYQGWHFTNMGGLTEIRRKLNDSYTQETYNTQEIQHNLESRLKNKVDYLNRPFTFKEDESEWPTFLKKNKSKYKTLLWPQ